ncbi:MAG: FadR/GntR family transcriptional regulator [Candidatus Sulfotelmatobacter sp.]|jgi:GntR family transcriptional repressor for pyruvate dehydrogenase complex
MAPPVAHMASSQQTRRKTPADTRITAKILERIKRLISTGAVVPGAKFPPERELAKEFGVNRASLRQALKVLEIMGVLTQRVGDGTYLSASAEATLKEPLDFLILLDDLSHHELLETRMIVEPELAARAAQRATAEDLIGLRKAIVSMEHCRTNQERLDADLAFHECIFRASGNRICHLLFRVIHRNLLTSMAQLSTRVPLDRPLIFHKRIYAAIQERNSEEARRQMLDHIADTKALLTSATK